MAAVFEGGSETIAEARIPEEASIVTSLSENQSVVDFIIELY